MTLIGKTFSRLKEEEIVRANDRAIERDYAVGNYVNHNGVRYKITRHKVVQTVPWATHIVYGRPA